MTAKLKVLYFIFFICSSFLQAQQRGRTDSKVQITEAIRSYFANYKLENYQPENRIQADSFLIDSLGHTLIVYANEAFCSQPFTPQNVTRIYKEFSAKLPMPYNTYSLRIVDKKKVEISQFIPNILRSQSLDEARLWGKIKHKDEPWVKNMSQPFQITSGLQDRHLFVWPSHGRYFKGSHWAWQRPYLFCTTEDLLTQSFVFLYLIPMLEHAGAIVYTPRERDSQTQEAVIDNDAPNRQGKYEEQSTTDAPWSTVSATGFSPISSLTDSIQPFLLGTVRQAKAVQRKTALSTITWTPRIPRTGEYAVYVSYASLPNSVSDARYTVYHAGGRTTFHVNQKIGGSTWVYLGTFLFKEGEDKSCKVVVSNQSDHKGVVTADAVRFGGGVGICQRGEESITSGMPRQLEAARYYAQWAGLPDSLYNTENGYNDYNDDIRARSNFLNLLGGSSAYMPDTTGRGVPFELALAFHTDAGIRADRSLYGTLGICTTTDANGQDKYISGLSRTASRDLASALMSSIVGDMSANLKRPWPQRELWDRNYGETRMPLVPSAIIEMLAHQNFTDMRYAHDPSFKFMLSRAIYKGILRYISYSHGESNYVVQPLPVQNFSALLSPTGNEVTLNWKPTADSLEPSALPTDYVVYTRTSADGDFDNGQLTKGSTSVTLPIKEGEMYSFRITAINAGGESFPSPILSVYSSPKQGAPQILLVDAFNRVSGPAIINTPDSLGFNLDADFGVPYLYTTAFAGKQLDFNPATAGKEGPGSLGYSSNELIGRKIAGNCFNGSEEHGASVAAYGKVSFSSVCKDAFNDALLLTRYAAIDYIAGLQKDVDYNLRPYPAMPQDVQRLLKKYMEEGGNLLISGSYIGRDLKTEADKKFARDVLHYTYMAPMVNDSVNGINGLNLSIPFYNTPNGEHFDARHTDIIYPVGKNAFSAFAYNHCNFSAGIAYDGGKNGNVVAMAFPFECIKGKEIREQVMKAILKFLLR